MEVPVNVVSVCVTEPSEAETVKVFGVDRAPMPLIAAVAPNGAVTKAWPLKATPKQLMEGLVSNGTAACMKAMQEQKLSLVCIHNTETAHSDAVQQAAAGFQADERFGAATEVIEINPADEREHTFLTSLKVSPKTRDAVAVLTITCRATDCQVCRHGHDVTDSSPRSKPLNKAVAPAVSADQKGAVLGASVVLMASVPLEQK